VVPLGVELVGEELVELGLPQIRLVKVVVLVLLKRGGFRPVRRPEDRLAQAAQYNRGLMQQAVVLAVLDLYAGHVQDIHVLGMPQPLWIPVIGGLGEDAHRNRNGACPGPE
jgi:hypothetical protein